MILSIKIGKTSTLTNLVPLGSNYSLDQISLNMVMVAPPTFKLSSSCDVSKLSRIIAMNRLRKMNETMIMKLIK